MSNREIAESIWPVQCRTRSQAIPAIVSALDAAERRGKIEMLKWHRDWPSDRRYSAIVGELDRLRAEKKEKDKT